MKHAGFSPDAREDGAELARPQRLPGGTHSREGDSRRFAPKGEPSRTRIEKRRFRDARHQFVWSIEYRDSIP